MTNRDTTPATTGPLAHARLRSRARNAGARETSKAGQLLGCAQRAAQRASGGDRG